MSSLSSKDDSGGEFEADDHVLHSSGWLIPAACLTMLTLGLAGTSEMWLESETPVVGPRAVAGVHISDAEVCRCRGAAITRANVLQSRIRIISIEDKMSEHQSGPGTRFCQAPEAGEKVILGWCIAARRLLTTAHSYKTSNRRSSRQQVRQSQRQSTDEVQQYLRRRTSLICAFAAVRRQVPDLHSAVRTSTTLHIFLECIRFATSLASRRELCMVGRARNYGCL